MCIIVVARRYLDVFVFFFNTFFREYASGRIQYNFFLWVLLILILYGI